MLGAAFAAVATPCTSACTDGRPPALPAVISGHAAARPASAQRLALPRATGAPGKRKPLLTSLVNGGHQAGDRTGTGDIQLRKLQAFVAHSLAADSHVRHAPGRSVGNASMAMVPQVQEKTARSRSSRRGTWAGCQLLAPVRDRVRVTQRTNGPSSRNRSSLNEAVEGLAWINDNGRASLRAAGLTSILGAMRCSTIGRTPRTP